ncbi:hypothetical protein [Streptomyces sp. BBFR115]|uniref:hypothetical protein n=1 Tax=Streptomyces sp. BBFR115 TaxID=3448173 RepID=UPI003F76F4A0
MTLRPGRPADAVAEALLAHGGHDAAVHLHGERISPAVRRRIAEQPDPALRDAYAGFVRHSVDRGVRTGIDALEEAYGRARAELVRASDPKLRAAVARAWCDRPLAVQAGLLTDPDPRVRAAAAERERPGVPAELEDRCLADPAVRAHAARHVPLTSARPSHVEHPRFPVTRRRAPVRTGSAGRPFLVGEVRHLSGW